MMGTAKHVGRIGALTVAAAMVVMVASPARPASPAVKLAAGSTSTALLVCGTTCPKWDAAGVDLVMNQFVKPTHPGQTIDSVAVTTPQEAWPLTGALRLLELALADPRLGGLGGPAFPDEPWWKLSGLFDLTGDRSIQTGAADLEAAMADYGDDHLVIYGYSQGAVVANVVRERLAAQYPVGTTAPDIDFVFGGDVGVPNGGFGARFPGLHIPILDWTYDGAEATNTQFHTDVITRQYDGFADFPLYPLNVIADLNAVLGLVYVHMWPFDASLPPDDPTTSPAYQGTYGETSPGHGGTSYYFFENQDLPLFGPLRTLGVPEKLIDVVEPFFRVLVELGYDRTIPAWEPTPARLIPPLNPAKVAGDLVDAIGEGVDNASAVVGSPVPQSSPAAARVAAPVSAAPGPADADVSAKMGAKKDAVQINSSPSTEPAAQQNTAASDSVTNASTPKPAKPARHPVKPRSVVRDSPTAGQRLSDRPHRRDAHQPTTRTAAARANAAADDSASAGDSSGGDADGSD